MMRTRKWLLANLLLSNLLLTACQDVPSDGFASIGNPERQLVVTTEATSLELKDKHSLDHLKEIIKTDPPKRAQLNCPTTDALCANAKSALQTANIPMEFSSPTEGAGDSINLIYQRIAAAECPNRYVDNSINSANLNAPTLGCSIRSNMVQMVTDKQQFVNPGLLDYQDGEKAAKTYQNYISPQADTSQSSSGGSGSSGSLIGATQ